MTQADSSMNINIYWKSVFTWLCKKYEKYNDGMDYSNQIYDESYSINIQFQQLFKTWNW